MDGLKCINGGMYRFDSYRLAVVRLDEVRIGQVLVRLDEVRIDQVLVRLDEVHSDQLGDRRHISNP